MTPSEIVAWSERQDALGNRDAMGGRWSDWNLAVRNSDGTYARDQHGHQIFETHATFKARATATPFVPVSPVGRTMDLFA